MIDTHLHVLPNLDDGSSSLHESIKILQQLEQLGFSEVLCTPHYIADSDYCPDNKTKQSSLRKLKQAAKKAGLKIKIHLWNEVQIDPKIAALVKNKEIKLAKNHFLLFELPFYAEFQGLKDLLHNLKIKNITPILAHPERYIYFQKDYRLVDQLKDNGLLFQVNYGSITGQYGRSAKKLTKYLLKHDYVDFLGTDVHHSDSQIFKNFPKIQRKIIRIIGPEKFKEIIQNAKQLV